MPTCEAVERLYNFVQSFNFNLMKFQSLKVFIFIYFNIELCYCSVFIFQKLNSGPWTKSFILLGEGIYPKEAWLSSLQTLYPFAS